MKNKIEKELAVLLYILVFVVGAVYLCRFLVFQYLLTLVYSFTLLLISGVCILYIILKTAVNEGVFSNSGMFLWFITFVTYELAVSFFKNLFPMPEIIDDVVTWPLLLYVFYDYSKDNEIPKIFYTITKIGMVIIYVLAIPNIRQHLQSFDGSAAFASYMTLSFFHLAHLFFNKKGSFIFSLILILLMMISTKRSGFLTALVGTVFIYFVKSILSDTNEKKLQKISLYFLALAIVYVLGKIIIENMDIPIFDRLKTISDDGGSGRTDIWDEILSAFRESPLKDRIFGHGFHAVYYELKPFGVRRFAHNSYVEYLYDYGYIGITLLIGLVIRLIIGCIAMIVRNKTYAPVMAYCIFAMLMLSLSSYFFEQSVLVVPFCVSCGICLGKYDFEAEASAVYTSRYQYIKEYYRIEYALQDGGDHTEKKFHYIRS